MGPCVVLVGFSEGAKWDLGPIFQFALWEGSRARVGAPIIWVQRGRREVQPQRSTITPHFFTLARCQCIYYLSLFEERHIGLGI